ncbi:MAG: hypothetical protein H0U21_08220 [Acidimicrobiia bacterium]|nr:hypothetical protein [Acidimicrobiia bacterium]
MTAAGSHWGLSTAAVADDTFVETHDPQDVFPAMDRTLFDVIPGCMNAQFVAAMASQTVPSYDVNSVDENGGMYLVHVETGKRVYQLYTELDGGDDSNPASLAAHIRDSYGNRAYLGPWAFETLGGAGGQTVFGALTTGTHGGDFRVGPIADAVMAMHLVVDGGHHYWIEPESLRHLGERMTDDGLLRLLYEDDRYRGHAASGRDNFTVVRDDTLFDAVRIGAFRFGIVYSVVLRAVRQYTLHQERRLTTWQTVRNKIPDPNSDLYRIDPPIPNTSYQSRFLQIAVCLTPTANFTQNLAGVTKRWNVELAANPLTGIPRGRAERTGANAGNSHGYSPDPADPRLAAEPSFLEQACTNANFVVGVIDEVAQEIQDFIDSNGAVVGAGLGAVVAAGGGTALLALIPALLVLLAILAVIAAILAATTPRLGNALNDLKDSLLNRTDPAERAAGLLIWQMIAAKIFSGQQGDLDYEAISYAVMDGHDYLDMSCSINVDSIEVFFDAADSKLLAYVDALLVFEAAQEMLGRAFVGYASLRFTNRTKALIGPEQWERTCVVEVAGLRDVTGVKELIDFATMFALNANIKGVLHWGQRNDSNRTEIQERFGDRPGDPTGPLTRWRQALGSVTQHGRLDGFSNAFSRQTGLEVVTPDITSVTGPTGTISVGQTAAITWDCSNNPSSVQVRLEVFHPSGARNTFLGLTPAGQLNIPVVEAGEHLVDLVVGITLGGEQRERSASVSVMAV